MGPSMDLFRAPVSGSAEERSITRIVTGESRHTEIRELDAILAADEHVRGLDVAMDNAATVSYAQGDRYLGGPIAGGWDGILPLESAFSSDWPSINSITR